MTGSVFLREIQPLGDALHVGIHHHPRGDAVGRAEHHVGGLAGGAGDGQHLFHGLRHLAAELGNHLLRRAHDGLGLVVEEAGAADIVGQNLRAHRREIRRRGVLGEQAGRHFVDALIGALGGKNGGHQQLPRVVMVERAGGGRVHLVQAAQDFGDALLPLGCGFRPFRVSS